MKTSWWGHRSSKKRFHPDHSWNFVEVKLPRRRKITKKPSGHFWWFVPECSPSHSILLKAWFSFFKLSLLNQANFEANPKLKALTLLGYNVEELSKKVSTHSIMMVMMMMCCFGIQIAILSLFILTIATVADPGFAKRRWHSLRCRCWGTGQ